MKKLFILLFALILTLSLFSCGKEEEKNLTCTVSIDCRVLLQEEYYSQLSEGVKAVLPEDGWILKPVEVAFSQGDTAFDVIKEAVKTEKIHMEFSESPIYNTAYVEGINNIYEYDCGPTSGWLFSVEGSYPNYGCSAYKLSDGDVITWVYSCEVGSVEGVDLD